ncbi:hypothetical protein HZH66_012995 [Vespula vulgaris]|uniref:Uncharacterized protein n=1 Tax=Vespula vulgaris TaxID=7454 RepID=A0A834MT85_VESVU|nr:hypothetical protein HZH66_012995 [Vespula vulgaris]
MQVSNATGCLKEIPERYQHQQGVPGGTFATGVESKRRPTSKLKRSIIPTLDVGRRQPTGGGNVEEGDDLNESWNLCLGQVQRCS